MRALASALATWIPFVWAGMVAAISFLEAPLKFRAPGITRALGLGIGRLVFRALQRTELAFAALLLPLLASTRPGRVPVLLYALVVTVLLAQIVWLRPRLDRRAQAWIDGTPPPESRLHAAYVAAETLKLPALFALGTVVAVRFAG